MFGFRLHLPLLEQEQLPGLIRLTITTYGKSFFEQAVVFGDSETASPLSEMDIYTYGNRLLFSETTTDAELQFCHFLGSGGRTPSFSPSPIPATSPPSYGRMDPWIVEANFQHELIWGIVMRSRLSNVPVSGTTLDSPMDPFPGRIIPVSILVT